MEECHSRLSWFWGLDEQKTSVLKKYIFDADMIKD